MTTKQKISLSLRTVLTLQMSIVGVLKLIGFDALYQQLNELNIPANFGFTIGIVEVACVFALWVKPLRGVALLLLLFLVNSAIAVHFGAAVSISKAVPAMFSFGVVSLLLFLETPKAILSILRQTE